MYAGQPTEYRAAHACGAGVPGVWAAFVADSLVCACIVGVVIWRKRE